VLNPRESATRERTSLDGLWHFALDPDGAGRADRWWMSTLPGRGEMPVPASFNDIVPTREARDHVGDIWYQRTFRVPRGWDGQRIVLRFDAATHRATAWVGGASVVAVADRPVGLVPPTVRDA
jgi:beta-glucuronidase